MQSQWYLPLKPTGLSMPTSLHCLDISQLTLNINDLSKLVKPSVFSLTATWDCVFLEIKRILNFKDARMNPCICCCLPAPLLLYQPLILCQSKKPWSIRRLDTAQLPDFQSRTKLHHHIPPVLPSLHRLFVWGLSLRPYWLLLRLQMTSLTF